MKASEMKVLLACQKGGSIALPRTQPAYAPELWCTPCTGADPEGFGGFGQTPLGTLDYTLYVLIWLGDFWPAEPLPDENTSQ